MDDDDVERNHALWMFLHSYAARAHVRVDIRMKSTRMKFTYAPRARARARVEARASPTTVIIAVVTHPPRSSITIHAAHPPRIRNHDWIRVVERD